MSYSFRMRPNNIYSQIILSAYDAGPDYVSMGDNEKIRQREADDICNFLEHIDPDVMLVVEDKLKSREWKLRQMRKILGSMRERAGQGNKDAVNILNDLYEKFVAHGAYHDPPTELECEYKNCRQSFVISVTWPEEYRERYLKDAEEGLKRIEARIYDSFDREHHSQLSLASGSSSSNTH